MLDIHIKFLVFLISFLNIIQNKIIFIQKKKKKTN